MLSRRGGRGIVEEEVSSISSTDQLIGNGMDEPHGVLLGVDHLFDVQRFNVQNEKRSIASAADQQTTEESGRVRRIEQTHFPQRTGTGIATIPDLDIDIVLSIHLDAPYFDAFICAAGDEEIRVDGMGQNHVDGGGVSNTVDFGFEDIGTIAEIPHSQEPIVTSR